LRDDHSLDHVGAFDHVGGRSSGGCLVSMDDTEDDGSSLGFDGDDAPLGDSAMQASSSGVRACQQQRTSGWTGPRTTARIEALTGRQLRK
jgi:hypothetical protein